MLTTSNAQRPPRAEFPSRQWRNAQGLSLAQLPKSVRRTGIRLGIGSWTSVLLGVVLVAFASAQQVDQSLLVKPTSDSWPTYHGDYSGQHHSRLTQITATNVSQLALAWAFNTGQTQQIKATPIVVNGVIYISTPDNVWAVDARAGRQLWRYSYPANEGFHIGHRGVAVRGELVYLTTPDAFLIALDARSGQV